MATSLNQFLMSGKGKIHMLGVSGVGMAGLARLLVARGFDVSGCDVKPGSCTDWLIKNGVRFLGDHSPSHLSEKPDLVIYSPAVPAENPELSAFRDSGILLYRRGAVLPLLLEGSFSIAVAGTHGKTSTSTFIAQCLKTSGRGVSWCIGGDSPELGGVSGIVEGTNKNIVVEADESDGTLILYAADIAIITNIEFDHMEHFENVEEFEACFKLFAAKARHLLIYCADDPRAEQLCRALPNSVSYGFSPASDVVCENIVNDGSLTKFTLRKKNNSLGEFSIPIQGEHNIRNAVAAVLALMSAGLSVEECRNALGNISLPKRRFELIAKGSGIKVISDYAHHPTEIKALISMAKRNTKGITAVFQPHRYSRTLALKNDFPAAFKGIDLLILAPVFPASEKKQEGSTTADLYSAFRSTSLNENQDMPKIVLSRELDSVWEFVHRRMIGDTFLIIGAGDVDKIGASASKTINLSPQKSDQNLLRELSVLAPSSTIKLCEPLGHKTTFGVGGDADIWIEIGSVNDLVKIREFSSKHDVPFQILGAGSNALVSDLGIRGITAKLAGNEFTAISLEGVRITVGASVPLSKLIKYCGDHALTGCEFLAGIPGSVGGAAVMNAGAFGCECSSVIESITCLNGDGTISTLTAKNLDWEYRRCKSLEDRIVIATSFKLQTDNKETIKAKIDASLLQREWMKGLRCAGSTFQNPPGNSAGRLIEAAGMKGLSIGGARIFEKHANFIVASEGTTASDVLALIMLAGDAVERSFGVQLKPEVVLFE